MVWSDIERIESRAGGVNLCYFEGRPRGTPDNCGEIFLTYSQIASLPTWEEHCATNPQLNPNDYISSREVLVEGCGRLIKAVFEWNPQIVYSDDNFYGIFGAGQSTLPHT